MGKENNSRQKAVSRMMFSGSVREIGVFEMCIRDSVGPLVVLACSSVNQVLLRSSDPVKLLEPHLSMLLLLIGGLQI